LGVLVTLAVAASLFVAATPVSAGIQSWTSITTPSGTGIVVSTAGLTVNAVGQLVYNSDKTVIYATANITTTTPAYTGMAILKSTNGGWTWSRVTIAALPGTLAGPGYIYDLMTSTVSANELYYTDGTNIYTSKDAGVTWLTLNNLFTYAATQAWANPPVAGVNLIVTMDMAVLGATKKIIVGTAVFNGTDLGNDVFVCDETVVDQPWTDLEVGTQRAAPLGAVSVWDVKIDPTDFAVKQGIFAVVSSATGTRITAKYQGNQWNQPTLTPDALILQTNVTPILTPMRAEIWLPSDFNSTITGTKFQAWVGLATVGGNQGDVYIWSGGALQTIDLNIAGPATNSEITDIDGVGTIATAKILASGYRVTPTPMVWYSPDGIAFTASTKPPTGGASWGGYPTTTILALDGFATSGRAIAGTGGIDGGVSFTQDFAKTFNQISLLQSDVLSPNGLIDMGGNFFIVTTNTAGTDSIWRAVTIGTATYWERIFTENQITPALVGNWDIEAAADGTLFLADIGGVRIWRSFDNGQTWGLQFNDIVSVGGTAITAWMPVNANSVMVGGASTVYYTTTNGIIWTAVSVAIGTITDFAVSGSNWYAVGVAAGGVVKAARSTDSGATWTVFTGSVTDATATTAYIAASGSTAYITKNGAGGVWRTTGGTFTKIDGNTYDTNGNVASGSGIVVGISTGTIIPEEGTGVIYATDSSAATEGVSRIRGSATQAESLDSPSGITLTGLWLTMDGTNNVLWSRGSNNNIYTYTDTLNKPGTGVTQVGTPTGTGFVIYGLDTQTLFGSSFVTTISWTALPNATRYSVYVSDSATDAGLTNLYTAAINGFEETNIEATQATLTGLAANTTYYVSVWATEPTSSFRYATYTFSTPPGVPNWTPNLSPMSGSQNVQVAPTPFDWDDVIGATSYEFQIAAANGIPAGTATVTLTQSAHSISNLAYDTFYTWRVRAMSGTVAGEWVTSVFSTTKAVVTPTVTSTTIVIPTQTAAPVPTINLPQPTVIVNPAPITVTIPPGTTLPTPTIVLPEAETPVYIWIIVAVGALLTIAVIVLIVRTRRVV
jgi:hypothetical protein